MKKRIFFIFALLFITAGPVFAGVDIQMAGHIGKTGNDPMFIFDIPVSVNLITGCINKGYYASSLEGTVCSEGGAGAQGIKSSYTLDAWVNNALLDTPYTFIINNGTDRYYFTVFKRGVQNWSLGTTGYSPIPEILGNTCAVYDVGCYLGQAIQYLFMPSQTSLDRFKTLFDLVKNKPPFGYIFTINTALAGLNDTETEVFTLGNISGLDTYIITPIRTALIWVLWLVFAFSFYKRVKNIEI